ncbi:MAG TPA: hypothetical protein VHK86_01145 [Nitrososphaera sp.]|nr:hypothetical protein [Nitrososphaera sp.]
MSQKHRLALPADEQVKCIDCGQPASYRIVHDEEVIRQEYYCKNCCS